MVIPDPRRNIPRTDRLLALPEVVAAGERLGPSIVRSVIEDVQSAAREGSIPVAEVTARVLETLSSARASSLTPVLNATGIIVHTNLGRAPLSPGAMRAVVDAGGYVDVELDLADGKRSKRGRGARAALLAACPAAEDALIVNNGAAALLLAITALRGPGPAGDSREVIISRGELVEIGAGFRLPDLMVTTGLALHEVGTTNRTHFVDYAHAIGPGTASLVKVHTSNFRVEGFTAEASIADLRILADQHGLPLIADLGSGLLAPDPSLPGEPDVTSALEAGADVVIVSGDKLLGGPQAGLLLGRRDAIEVIARHPLARAMRTDKLTLAALEATVAGASTPVTEALHADPGVLRSRTQRLAAAVGEEIGARNDGTRGREPNGLVTAAAGIDSAAASDPGTDPGLAIVAHDGRVGGGGAPGVPLTGLALELPEALAGPLRLGDPAVVARTHQGRCLVDLRCVPESDDARLAAAIVEAWRSIAPAAPIAPAESAAPASSTPRTED